MVTVNKEYNKTSVEQNYTLNVKYAIAHDIARKLLEQDKITFTQVTIDGKTYLRGTVNI